MTTNLDLRDAELPERGSKIGYQKVFDELHKDAVARLPPGTRYEIRLMGRPPFRRITVHSTDAMNQIEPWTNTPEQTDDHYRVSRCTTPKEP